MARVRGIIQFCLPPTRLTTNGMNHPTVPLHACYACIHHYHRRLNGCLHLNLDQPIFYRFLHLGNFCSGGEPLGTNGTSFYGPNLPPNPNQQCQSTVDETKALSLRDEVT